MPWAAQGRGGASTPGGVRKLRGCGTWGHGPLVALAVLEAGLDVMVLEGFSNLNNSVVL